MANFNELYNKVIAYNESVVYTESAEAFKEKIASLKKWADGVYSKAKLKVSAAIKSDNTKAAKQTVINVCKQTEAKVKSIASDVDKRVKGMREKIVSMLKRKKPEAVKENFGFSPNPAMDLAMLQQQQILINRTQQHFQQQQALILTEINRIMNEVQKCSDEEGAQFFMALVNKLSDEYDEVVAAAEEVEKGLSSNQ